MGSRRPFVVTSGTAGLTLVPGRVATEDDEQDLSSPAAARIPGGGGGAVVRRARGAGLGGAAAAVGARRGDHGFSPAHHRRSRAKGVSAYPGDGSNRWAAGHRLDAAHLYRLALEEAPGGTRLHAVGDEGVPVRDIADAVGRYLKLPVAAIPQRGGGRPLRLARTLLPRGTSLRRAPSRGSGWDEHPERPGLVEDLEEGRYFAKSLTGCRRTGCRRRLLREVVDGLSQTGCRRRLLREVVDGEVGDGAVTDALVEAVAGRIGEVGEEERLVRSAGQRGPADLGGGGPRVAASAQGCRGVDRSVRICPAIRGVAPGPWPPACRPASPRA